MGDRGNNRKKLDFFPCVDPLKSEKPYSLMHNTIQCIITFQNLESTRVSTKSSASYPVLATETTIYGYTRIDKRDYQTLTAIVEEEAIKCTNYNENILKLLLHVHTFLQT